MKTERRTLCAPAPSSSEDLVRRDAVSLVSSICPVILQVLLLQQLDNMHCNVNVYVHTADISGNVNDVRGCEYVEYRSMQTVRHFVNAVTHEVIVKCV